MDDDWKMRILKAKMKARSELSIDKNEWRHENHHKTFDENPDHYPDNIERIDATKVSKEEFAERFEKTFRPVMILNAQAGWKATKEWEFHKLAMNYKDAKFKVAEDDHGNDVRVKLQDFVPYMVKNKDDSPLYVFEPTFGEKDKTKRLLKDYAVHPYFREDLLRHLGEDRPPYRWFVMGPSRSGTSIHIDPLATSAWNALVKGYKRWVMFPNHIHKKLVTLPKKHGGKHKFEAIAWFTKQYPKIKDKNYPMIECVQRPGETIFVPSGWWHVVINLDDTVAVTQNFVSSYNFYVAYSDILRRRPRLANRFYKVLQKVRPDLVVIADSIDKSKRPVLRSDDDTDWENESELERNSYHESLTDAFSNGFTISEGRPVAIGAHPERGYANGPLDVVAPPIDCPMNNLSNYSHPYAANGHSKHCAMYHQVHWNNASEYDTEKYIHH